MKFIIMAAVHILNFGEMAGFKIVPFTASHVKMNFFFFSWNYEKTFSAYQNSPICIKTTDIELFRHRRPPEGFHLPFIVLRALILDIFFTVILVFGV